MLVQLQVTSARRAELPILLSHERAAPCWGADPAPSTATSASAIHHLAHKIASTCRIPGAARTSPRHRAGLAPPAKANGKLRQAPGTQPPPATWPVPASPGTAACGHRRSTVAFEVRRVGVRPARAPAADPPTIHPRIDHQRRPAASHRSPGLAKPARRGRRPRPTIQFSGTSRALRAASAAAPPDRRTPLARSAYFQLFRPADWRGGRTPARLRGRARAHRPSHHGPTPAGWPSASNSRKIHLGNEQISASADPPHGQPGSSRRRPGPGGLRPARSRLSDHTSFGRSPQIARHNNAWLLAASPRQPPRASALAPTKQVTLSQPNSAARASPHPAGICRARPTAAGPVVTHLQQLARPRGRVAAPPMRARRARHRPRPPSSARPAPRRRRRWATHGAAIWNFQGVFSAP